MIGVSGLRRLISGLVVLAGLSLAACSNPSVSALHDPLYRASSHVSTITAIGSDSQNGIDSVSISVTAGVLTACNNFTPSLIPCRTAVQSFGRECIFSHERGPAVCRLPDPLRGDAILVAFETDLGLSEQSVRAAAVQLAETFGLQAGLIHTCERIVIFN